MNLSSTTVKQYYLDVEIFGKRIVFDYILPGEYIYVYVYIYIHTHETSTYQCVKQGHQSGLSTGTQ